MNLNLTPDQLERIIERFVCSEAKIKAFFFCLNLSRMLMGLISFCSSQIQVNHFDLHLSL